MAAAGSVILLIAVLLSEQIGESVVAFIEKLHRLNESGQDRFASFEHMAGIGFRDPFGIGFGSGRSKDLLSTWLCTIGIVGTTLFLCAAAQIAVGTVKRREFGQFIPFALVLISMFTSVPEPYNLFVWYFIFYAMTGQRSQSVVIKTLPQLADERA